VGPASDLEGASGIFDRIRGACRTVAAGATWTRIDPDGVRRLADRLVAEPARGAFEEEFHHAAADQVVAYALTWNTVNYGSGWFPILEKLPGRSGSRTLMTHLQDQFVRSGTWTAAQLAEIGPPEVATVFHQDLAGPAGELMRAFAGSWRQLGRWLVDSHDGSFTGPVETAAGSAARLVELLLALDDYRDVHTWRGLEVPLCKRSQITVSDLHHSLGGRGLGRFDDVGQLTLFADNLVPHVLAVTGVLVHDARLTARIGAGELLASGEAAEVELRAAAVHATEQLVAAMREQGRHTTAADVDHRLWRMGQDPAIKATPRHRCRCTYY
jgi:Potential Queuosine, Q, salvage protein family